MRSFLILKLKHRLTLLFAKGTYSALHPMEHLHPSSGMTVQQNKLSSLPQKAPYRIQPRSKGETSGQITVSPGSKEISVEIENEYGCTGTDSIQIEECDAAAVFEEIPNLITPNGDGKNDQWIIDDLDGFPDAVVEIYDRWGRLVFKSEEGYPAPWDGTNMNGNAVPTGSYHYVIMLNHPDFRQISGALSVIR